MKRPCTKLAQCRSQHLSYHIMVSVCLYPSFVFKMMLYRRLFRFQELYEVDIHVNNFLEFLDDGILLCEHANCVNDQANRFREARAGDPILKKIILPSKRVRYTPVSNRLSVVSACSWHRPILCPFYVDGQFEQSVGPPLALASAVVCQFLIVCSPWNVFSL